MRSKGLQRVHGRGRIRSRARRERGESNAWEFDSHQRETVAQEGSQIIPNAKRNSEAVKKEEWRAVPVYVVVEHVEIITEQRDEPRGVVNENQL